MRTDRLRTILIAMTLITITAMPSEGEAAETITLADAIESALNNHPSVAIARETLNASRAQVTQATSPYLPQIRLGTGYAENRATTALGKSVTNSYTTTVTANQLIYDFGRTGKTLDAARSTERTAEFERQRTVQEVILNVRQAYYGALKSIALQSVAEKNLEQARAHLAQADAFFRAGSRPRFDVTRTEVEVNSAKLSALNAANGVRIARSALGNAMGVRLPDDLELADTPLDLVQAQPLEEAQRDALIHRPEMLSMAAEIEAAEAKLKADQSLHLPNISANGSYNWSNGSTTMGSYRSDLDASWNAGIMLNLSLFEGGLTSGRIAEARANLNRSIARRESLTQSIVLEVNQAYADLENAAARLDVMESSLRKATENREIAQGRYQAGVGPYIEVTDASLAELTAEVDFVQARYDYQLSAARLEKAMGRTEALPRSEVRRDAPRQ